MRNTFYGIVFLFFLSFSTVANMVWSQAVKPMADSSFFYGQCLFKAGDGGCFWRIPAILCLDNGTLIVACDRRKNDEGDLPHDIDVVVCSSRDNGRTWSSPVTVAKGRGEGHGYGDPALVQCANGDIVCTFAGGGGFWNSNCENPIRTYVSVSRDNGVSWSEPVDITSVLWGTGTVNHEMENYRGSFNASGNGLILRRGKNTGRIMFVAAMCRSDVWRADNFAVYSDDGGVSWQVSSMAYKGGDEAKVLQMPDGRLLMSVRQKGARGYALSDDDGETWHGQEKWNDMVTNACNGEMLLLDSFAGRSDVVLHSLPNSMDRENLSLFVSYDGGETWPDKCSILPGPSAYSSMTRLPDGSIAMFVEKLVNGKTELWFLNFSLEWLQNAIYNQR